MMAEERGNPPRSCENPVRSKERDRWKPRRKPKHACAAYRTSGEEFFVCVKFGAVKIQKSEFAFIEEALQH